MKMLMSLIGELITRESFACQNGHYKLTCQCEKTISYNFKILANFEGWGGGQEVFVVGALPSPFAPLWRLRPWTRVYLLCLLI